MMKKLILFSFLALGCFLVPVSPSDAIECGPGQTQITVQCVDVPFPTPGPFTRRVCDQLCNWDEIHYSPYTGSCTWCENGVPGIGQ